MKIARQSCVLIILCFFIFSFGSSQKLNKSDVRKTMEEMLAYHVDYKEFTTLLAKRSVKLYLEQFDAEKKYLLAKEAQVFFKVSEAQLQQMVQKYHKDDVSEYVNRNRVIEQAILRARRIRAEVELELIKSDEVFIYPQEKSYADYSKNEEELKNRIRLQLIQLLLLEKKWNKWVAWGQEEKLKVFALWERRIARYENPYLSIDLRGKALPSDMVNHYLTLHMLKAMAKSLDAHTAYFSPEEAFEMRASLEKQFEGIGIVLREGINGVLISDLIKGGPAEKSQKIMPGDLITTVDGVSVANAAYEDILGRLHGSQLGKVRVGVRRVDDQGKESYHEVELKKEKIVMLDERLQYTFEPYADGIIAKLTLPSFYEGGGSPSCEKDIRDALQALRKEGTIYGVVLDLRENSGGFLSQAVKVAGLFISSGVIVVSKYAKGEVQYLRDVDARSYYSGPLVVLTSKASASAAEIVAQALQDYGVALVIGDERTYGKGTIQYQTVTDGRAARFYKVTVGRYYTVSGRSTQIEGVKADIVVPTAYSPYNIGEKYLEYALKSDQIPSVYIDPLVDVDQRNQAWFQRNYLPNVQKKLSAWHQMLPHLKGNSSYRLAADKNYQLFLKSLEPQMLHRFTPTAKENFGVDDLQMTEAVSVIKDMMMIRTDQINIAQEIEFDSDKKIAQNL